MKPIADASSQVVDCLRRGGVVTIPTDTVYGLAAMPDSASAVARIYTLKDRPPEKRLPVIAKPTQLGELGIDACRTARKLMAEFWPGPLTIAFGVRKPLVEWLRGRDEVAVRWPKSELIDSILDSVGPFVMTSANPSGSTVKSSLSDVLRALKAPPDLAIDGGSLAVLSSTLVNLNARPPRYERCGPITLEQIREAGEVQWLDCSLE